MRRLILILLLIGVVAGLAVQVPAQALSVPSSHGAMVAGDMAAMPDCMASMRQDATHRSCKCDMAGCIALAANSTVMVLVAESTIPLAAVRPGRIDLAGLTIVLKGRSPAPEPEPPAPSI